MIDAVAAISMTREPGAFGAARGAGSAAAGTSREGGGEGGGGFAGELAQVRQAAIQYVSSAFIVPILERLHESPFQVEPFAANFAEKRFAPLLDEQIADRIVGSANFKLVDDIVERVAGRLSTARPAPEALDAH